MALPNNPTAAELVKEVKSLATTKQNALTAGDNITISNDTISASTGLKQINNSIGYIQYSYYTDFTTTSEYVGYYIKDGVYYIEVTFENKDSLSIVAGTTAAYLQGNAATSVSHNNISATLYKGDYFIDANNVENALSSTSRNPVQNKVIKAALDNKQNALPTTSTAGKVLKSTSTAGTVEWGDASSAGSTDVQVDGTSITSNNVADLKTINGNYNASSNKLATASDLPADEVFVGVYGTTAYAEITHAIAYYKELTLLIPPASYSARYMGIDTSSRHVFVRVIDNQLISYTCTSANVWATSTFSPEDVSNKVTSISASSTNVQYPSAKCVYDAIGDVAEVAAGKTASYIVDDTVATNTAFNSQNTTITLTAAFTDVNLGSVTLDKLAIGDVFYVTQTDVPDRWVQTIVESSGSYTVTLNKMETAKVPVTDVQVDGTSIVSSNVASVATINGDYNASTNKLATESDLPDLSTKMDKENPTGTGSFSMNAAGIVGANSFTEGDHCLASGFYAHAEGEFTVASGDYGSHSEGRETLASGVASHAEGTATIAQRKSQHVFGELNVADTTGTTTTRGEYIEIVGNGTYDTSTTPYTAQRSNARTLDWSGNEVLAGTSQATGFKTPNGTSDQVLTADGSVQDMSDVVHYDASGTSTTESTLLDSYYTKNDTDSLLNNSYFNKTETNNLLSNVCKTSTELYSGNTNGVGSNFTVTSTSGYKLIVFKFKNSSSNNPIQFTTIPGVLWNSLETSETILIPCNDGTNGFYLLQRKSATSIYVVNRSSTSYLNIYGIN